MPRSSDPVFWPGSEVDTNIRNLMQSSYNDSITNLQVQWEQADLDERTALGDPAMWSALFPQGIMQRRRMFNFNLTQATINMVSGHQRRNRKSTIAIPVKNRVQKTADQLTKCLYHVHNQNNVYQTYSDGFERGALIQGFGLFSIFPDFSTDPVSPDIKVRFVDFKSVLMDPFFRQKDLSDCRYIWTRQYFSKEEAVLLYPEHREEIENTPYGGAPKDDKFYYMPENFGLQQKKLIAFDEYWYLAHREAIYAVDIETDEVKELDGDEEDIRIVMLEFKDRLKIIRRTKQTVKRAILLNGRVLVDEMRPYGLDRYPYVGIYGHFNPDTPYIGYKFKGMVRDMRDAQYLYNIRKVTDLDILSSQQQGLKVKKGALLTPDDSLNQGNGRVLVINDKMQMDDVQPMEIIPPSPVMLQMEDMLKMVMREISGVNEELLGAAIDDKAGVLSMLRQGAGLTTLQKFFDQMDQTQKECGDIIIQLIQYYWSYGKIMAVIGEEPTPEFDDKAFFQYGAKIVQGVLTDTQQQLELGQILQLNEIMATRPAPPIMEKIIDTMYIQNKEELKQSIAQFQQAEAQQQQQMSQLQMQQLQVDNQTKISYAESQSALAQERQAKISTDNALAQEKVKQAEREETTAVLNLVKTLKELEGLDIDNLAKKLQMVQSMQNEQVEEKELQEVY